MTRQGFRIHFTKVYFIGQMTCVILRFLQHIRCKIDDAAMEAYRQDRQNSAELGLGDVNIGENFRGIFHSAKNLSGEITVPGGKILARFLWKGEHYGFQDKDFSL